MNFIAGELKFIIVNGVIFYKIEAEVIKTVDLLPIIEISSENFEVKNAEE
jgi:hypothetical protein